MNLVFYQAPFSSALPVAAALAELDVPHESVVFDLSQKEHKKLDYLAIHPAGKVPALVVNGTPMFEALAILQWLGDRFGVDKGLWPAAASPDRLRALSWTTWAYCSFGQGFVRYNFATSERLPEDSRSPAQAALAQTDVQEMHAVLEAHLNRHQYMLGDEYSLVDLVLANTLHYASFCGLPPKDEPKVQAWLSRCMARPANSKQWQPPSAP